MPTPDTPAQPAAPARKGRPATGQALSSTERSRTRRKLLRQAGRAPVTVCLTAEAAAALAQLRAGGQTVDQAVSAALVAALGTPTV